MIPKLEVNGVSYSYHSLDGETLALDHISFDVSPGESWLSWDLPDAASPPFCPCCAD